MANRWFIEEESLLANIWLVVHEFPREPVFWNDVTARFNEQSDGNVRNKSQIKGKWARLTCECEKFNDIYLNLQPTREVNGRLFDAIDVFKERYGDQGFKYLHVWLILQNSPAWNRYRN
jgi:hypothetical protein